MSIERVTCYTVTCTRCLTMFDESAECIIHFDTHDDAVNYITENGWILTGDGDPICHRCHVVELCRIHGHDLTEWIPCGCRGLITEHAWLGCGLYRMCKRDGCGHVEDRTLAQLPTIQEPTTPGC